MPIFFKKRPIFLKNAYRILLAQGKKTPKKKRLLPPRIKKRCKRLDEL